VTARPPPCDDLLDDGFPTAHRLDRDPWAGQVDLLLEVWNRRDLVRLVVGGDLA
jgi:hypothetical protein